MVQSILSSFEKLSYNLFTAPYQLNIVGVRNRNMISNTFNDQIIVFCKDDSGAWVVHVFTATTLPGVYWLRNPMNKNGTAILIPGQYKDSHQIGLHRGKYSALIQKSAVKVLRDNDRNGFANPFANVKALTTETGYFGINIHRADAAFTSLKIGKYSAGCQVFANPKEFDLFMQLANNHKKLHGNSFTYTLLSQEGM